MEEVVKLLGPWPVLQFMFGISVLGFGVFMIVKGLGKRDEPVQIEDKRAEWLAYEHLRNIEENSFKLVELHKQLLDQLRHTEEQLKALSAAIWNRGV